MIKRRKPSGKAPKPRNPAAKGLRSRARPAGPMAAKKGAYVRRAKHAKPTEAEE